jgi:hypothetical protein
MPSIPTVVRLITSLAALAQPQVSKFFDATKENSKLQKENEKLIQENNALKKQKLILLVVILLLSAAFISAIMLLFAMKGRFLCLN